MVYMFKISGRKMGGNTEEERMSAKQLIKEREHS